MWKLPNNLESEQAEAICSLLSSSMGPVAPEGTKSEFLLPKVRYSKELEKALGLARRCGKLRGGLENIQVLLQKEEAGLEVQRKKNNSPASSRVSRLLLVSNDGASRFYQQVSRLLERHGERILGLYIETPGDVLGAKFFGSKASVKALLVDHKEFVSKILESLTSDSDK